MRENIKEKSLVQVRNSLLEKIKGFIRKVFRVNSDNKIVGLRTKVLTEEENKKDTFRESLKKMAHEEIMLLKLQKQYRNGEIKEEELSDEQVNSLCKLYDKQIEELKKSNERRKQRLLEYKIKMQTDNKNY